MPNNCSTLIQRKQNNFHKVVRTNSESKIQDGNPTEMYVAGTRKSSAHPASASPSAAYARRSTLFMSHRVQPAIEQTDEAHLPWLHDESGSRPRPKTPLTISSAKSPTRPLSTSMSSTHHISVKRPSEHFISTSGDLVEIILSNPAAGPDRRPRRVNGENSKSAGATHQLTPRPSGNAAVDSNQQQQQRILLSSARSRPTTPKIVQVESSLVHDRALKERTNTGQLYQRRPNNSIKAPIKEKIDRYRRRSEKLTHVLNGVPSSTTSHTAPSLTTPTSTSPSPVRFKAARYPDVVRRVVSDAEIQARLHVLRLSIDTKLAQAEQRDAPARLRSPYSYTNHQQASPAVVTTPKEPIPPVTPSQPRPSSVKPSNPTNQGNVYLAFIASRHLSTLEDHQLESDLDPGKLLQIFHWLKTVEEHRHEQSNHEQLLLDQNQRMLDQEENLSLYSDVRFAVDDLPPNTTGKACERIATMHFDN